MESLIQQWRESATRILSTSHCEFYDTCSCNYMHNEPSIWHQFTLYYSRELVSLWRIIDPKFIEIIPLPTSLLLQPYEVLPSIINLLCISYFFLFLSHTFVGLSDPHVNPRILWNTHLIHTLVCVITMTTKFVLALLLYQSNNFQFSAKSNTSMYSRNTFTLHVNSFHSMDSLKIICIKFRILNLHWHLHVP